MVRRGAETMMTAFPVLDTAFTGFGIVRHKPVAVLIWALVLLVISTALSVVVDTMGVRFGPQLQQLAAMNANAKPDPVQAMALMRQLAPFCGLLLALPLIVYPVLFAAMNRAVLRPAEDAFGYIRLGADEVRQLGLILIYYALALVVAIPMTVVAGVPATVIATAIRQPVLVPQLATAFMFVALAALWVRVSLASAQTFTTRKIDVFGSWTLTKGQFWPMAGTYAIAAVLFTVVALLGHPIIVAGGAVAGGDFDVTAALAHAQTPQAIASAYLTPAFMVQTVLGAALEAIALPILMTPAPAIYRALVSGPVRPANGF
jgi:hypothetical protein